MGAENLLGKAQIGQRNVKRSRVLLAARLQTSRGEIDARLRDLSRRGALIESDETLPIGEEVVFSRGDTMVRARVAWTGGNRIGLEFLQPIKEAEVLFHVSRPGASRTQIEPPSRRRFRRPSFSESLSDYERKLALVIGASLGVRLIDE